MHYPPETACIMLLARIIATVRQATDKEGAIALFMQFCHRTVNEEEEIAHKLLGAEFHDQLETLRNMMEKALWTPDIQHVRRFTVNCSLILRALYMYLTLGDWVGCLWPRKWL